MVGISPIEAATVDFLSSILTLHVEPKTLLKLLWRHTRLAFSRPFARFIDCGLEKSVFSWATVPALGLAGGICKIRDALLTQG